MATCSHDCCWHSLEKCNPDASNNRATHQQLHRRCDGEVPNDTARHSSRFGGAESGGVRRAQLRRQQLRHDPFELCRRIRRDLLREITAGARLAHHSLHRRPVTARLTRELRPTHEQQVARAFARRDKCAREVPRRLLEFRERHGNWPATAGKRSRQPCCCTVSPHLLCDQCQLPHPLLSLFVCLCCKLEGKSTIAQHETKLVVVVVQRVERVHAVLDLARGCLEHPVALFRLGDRRVDHERVERQPATRLLLVHGRLGVLVIGEVGSLSATILLALLEECNPDASNIVAAHLDREPPPRPVASGGRRGLVLVRSLRPQALHRSQHARVLVLVRLPPRRKLFQRYLRASTAISAQESGPVAFTITRAHLAIRRRPLQEVRRRCGGSTL